MLLVVAALVQRWIARGSRRRRLEARFRDDVRKLDLTVLQVDVLHILARRLRDRDRKYLLLSNRHTFYSCAHATGRLQPPLDNALRTLAERLGYSEPTGIALELERFRPAVGTVVKVEDSGSFRRALAHVQAVGEKDLRVLLEEEPGFTTGTRVEIYASHPSGIVIAQGLLAERSGMNAVVRLEGPFAEPRRKRLDERGLRILVRREGGTAPPEPTEIRSLWPTGAVLGNPNHSYRTHDDIQIVMRRNHENWVYVNAEVQRTFRRRSVMRVRFSHLSDEARREVLGRSV